MSLGHRVRESFGKAFRFSSKHGLSTKEKWRVSLPGPALSIGSVLIHNVFIKLYTDVIGLSPEYVGWVYVIYNIWNAINDPLLGAWIDKMRVRPGRNKYIYLMRVTIPFMVISSFLMILSGPSWSQWLIFAVYTLELFIYDTAATAYSVAYASYTLIVAPTKEERVDVNIITNYISQAMSFVITLIPTLLLVGDGRREIIIPVFTVVILLETVFFIWALRGLPDTSEMEKTVLSQQLTWHQIWKESWSIIRTRAFLTYVIFSSLVLGPIRFYFTPFLYYMDHVLRVDGMTATIIDVTTHVGVLLLLPMIGRLARRIGTKHSVYGGIVPALLGYSIIFLTRSAPVAWVGYYFIVLTVNYLGTVTSPMGALVIDDDERRTGIRKTGLYNGLFALFVTAFSGLQTVIFTGIISAFGYDGTQRIQSESAVLGIRIATAVVPLAAYIIGLIPIKLYPFDKAEEEAISNFSNNARRGTSEVLDTIKE